jgi:hypothetical protein
MYEHKPDNIEKGIRFGCGGLLGIIIAIAIIFYLGVYENISLCIAVFVICILVSGILLMKMGDEFIYMLRDLFD